MDGHSSPRMDPRPIRSRERLSHEDVTAVLRPVGSAVRPRRRSPFALHWRVLAEYRVCPHLERLPKNHRARRGHLHALAQ